MSRIRRITFACIFFVMALGHVARAQLLDYRAYSVDDGLAQSQVLSLYQDDRGALWIGTNDGGVSRYDGRSFRNYTEAEGLADNHVFSITQDGNGNMVFGTLNGLSIFNGKTFSNYTTENGLVSERIYKVLRAHDGKIWIGTSKGVSIWDGTEFTPFFGNDSIANGLVFSLFEDSNHHMWVGSFTAGALRVVDNQLKLFGKKNGLRDQRIRSVAEDASGSIWLGTGNGLYKLTEDIVEEIPVAGLEGMQMAVNAMFMDNRGRMWIATYAGGFCWTGNGFRHIGSESGLTSESVWTFLQDREGMVWFGTNGKGICGLRSERFTNFDIRSGLAGDVVYAIHADQGGNIWVGSEDGGLSRISMNKTGSWEIKNLNDLPDAPEGGVNAIAEDKEGRLWLGLRRAGVATWDGKRFKHLKFGDENIDGADVFHIMRDRFNRMWLSTFWGACVIDNGKADWVHIDSSLIPEDKRQVYCSFEDQDGSIWLATDNGVLRYNQKSFQHFTAKAGFTDGRVRTILSDHEGNIWFATDEGVFLLRNGNFSHFNTSNGLSSDKVYLMHFDRRGYMWLGTTKGVDKFNVLTYLAHDSISVRHYGKSEGLMGVECNANAVEETKGGYMWFGTVKGVARYSFMDDFRNTREPITRILNLRLKSEDFDWSQYSDSINPITGVPVRLRLPHDMRHLTFDYEAISLLDPQHVRYSYILEGLDNAWSAPTEKHDIPYPYIPPGEYRFNVKARNGDGVWNRNPASIGMILIEPPFWLTTWFYVVCTIGLIVFVFLFIKFRERRLQQEKRELENIVAERTREVVEQKEIIEAKNKDITDSINYARRIQEALLPPGNLESQAFSDSFVLFRPKDIVSGDFYWFGTRAGIAHLAAVDCTGHGVPGAFMSMIGHNLLNQIILEQGIAEPGEILTALNRRLKKAFNRSKRENDTRDGMDMALCSIDSKTGQLMFAGAMRPLYMFADNELKEIKGDKQPIGGLTSDDFHFTTHRLDWAEGDAFYIFSDGYADQFGGPSGKKFMSKKLREIITGMQHQTMQEQLKKLVSEFESWKGKEVQVDDVLVMGVRR
ncbi:MAG: SpoIIE family protein phosphatase [Flavobacteriales bacterium]|nr:SpoIIE family protein phosphatase [Flavobacteriales bacterium]